MRDYVKDAIYGLIAMATLPLTATACFFLGFAWAMMRLDPDDFFETYFGIPTEWPWMLESWLDGRKGTP